MLRKAYKICWVVMVIGINLISLNAQQTIGFIQNEQEALNGYVLWAVADQTYLVDNCGYEINRWQHGTNAALASYLTSDGTLMRAGRIPGIIASAGVGGLIEEYDWAGDLIWSYELNNDSIQQHHDIEPMPNGNVLAIAWELITMEKSLAAGSANPTIYWSEKIVEIEKTGPTTGNIVWEWRAWDHLVQDFDSSKGNFGIIAEYPELLNVNYEAPTVPGGSPDWLHFNGIDYDPLRDEIILSSRVFNEIFVIDHSTNSAEAATHTGGNRGKGGDILYRWGNPQAYQMGDEADQQFYGQHNAEVIPEGFDLEGGISVFNNGNDRPEGEFATVDIILPTIDGAGDYVINQGAPYGPINLAWQYKAPMPEDFSSKNMAGAHRLSNDNTFICEANTGRFFEVTTAGDIVWTYQNPVSSSGPLPQGSLALLGGSAFKSIKYAQDFEGFMGKDLTAGAPIELNPLNYDCNYYNHTSIEQNVGLSGVIIRQAEDVIYINNESRYAALRFQLLDISGRDIISGSISRLNNELNVSSLHGGLYVLHIFAEQEFMTTRIYKN